jgi:hypothetical protein
VCLFQYSVDERHLSEELLGFIISSKVAPLSYFHTVIATTATDNELMMFYFDYPKDVTSLD